MDREEIEQLIDQKLHMQRHDGIGGQLVNLQDIFGLFSVVSSAPTGTPRSVFEQVKIYSSAGTYRLYVYDSTSAAWHYTALT
jgi:hypothetical protein